MTTFVLILFFWETARGYAVTNIPGYTDKAACEQSAKEIMAPNATNDMARSGYVRAFCVAGPTIIQRGQQ